MSDTNHPAPYCAVCNGPHVPDSQAPGTIADRRAAADKAIDDKAMGRLADDLRKSPFDDKPLTDIEKERIRAYVESQRPVIEAIGRWLDRNG